MMQSRSSEKRGAPARFALRKTPTRCAAGPFRGNHSRPKLSRAFMIPSIYVEPEEVNFGKKGTSNILECLCRGGVMGA